jgi:hypothetical protein
MGEIYLTMLMKFENLLYITAQYEAISKKFLKAYIYAWGGGGCRRRSSPVSPVGGSQQGNLN